MYTTGGRIARAAGTWHIAAIVIAGLALLQARLAERVHRVAVVVAVELGLALRRALAGLPGPRRRGADRVHRVGVAVAEEPGLAVRRALARRAGAPALITTASLELNA